MSPHARTRLYALSLLAILGLLMVMCVCFSLYHPIDHTRYSALFLALFLPAFTLCCITILRLIKRLCQAEEQLRGVFDSTFEFIALLDASGHILRANQAALDFGSCEQERIAEHLLWDTPCWLADEETRREVQKMVEKAAQGQLCRSSVTIGNPQGQRITLDFSVKPIHTPSGEVKLLIAEGRDISEQAAISRALQKSEKLFREAMHHSAIGMALNDLEGNWIRVNPALCQILGYTEAELLQIHFKDLTPEEDKELDNQNFPKLLSGEKVDFEKRYVRKNGETIAVRICGSLIQDEDGKPEAIISQIINIQVRKQAEENLLRLRSELEERVAERTRDLWGVNANLLGERQKMLLLKEIAEESNRSGDLDSILRHTLEALAKLTRWPFGQVWKREPTDNVLATSDIWHAEDHVTYASLVQARQSLRFTEGNGIVGQTMQARQPLWRNDIENSENLIGHTELHAAGLHFAATLPILVRGEVHAVLQFFSPVPGGGVGEEMRVFVGQLTSLLQIIAERKIEENEIRGLAMVVQHILSAIVIADAGGRIEWVNPSFNRITGYTLAEVRGKKPGHFLQGPESDRAAIARIGSALRAGENVQEEVLNYTKSGEKYWASLVIQPVRDASGAINGFIAIQQDITRRKLAEEALQRKDRELNALVRHLGDAVITIDQSGSVRSANLAAERLFGYESLDGRHFDLLIPHEYRQQHRKLLAAAPALTDEFGLVMNHEIEGLHQDGSHIPIEATVTMYRVDEHVYYTALLHDIRKRKQTIAELTEARDAAQAANRAKSAFLAAMSHEIRTPLNGVVGMIDLLAVQALHPGQLEMIGTIKDSAFALLSIIDDILDFSKIEAGRLDLTISPVDIREVIEGVAETLTPIADKKACFLTAFIDPAITGDIMADALRLRQIFLNLVGNAVKFSGHEGEGAGHVAIRADLLATTCKEKPVRIRFSVSDNGIGIDENTQQRLFKPFSQAESSTTRRFGGTGLGLSICKRLTEMMGGTIGLESSLGKGSVFTVTVDFAAADPLPQKIQPEIADIDILIPCGHSLLDDIACYLEAAGCRIKRARQTEDIDRFLHSPREEALALIVLLDPDYQVPLCQKIGKILMEHSESIGRLLYIGRGRRHQPRLKDDRTVLIEGPLIRRQTLLDAVAILAGRHSPPQEVPVPVRAASFSQRPPPPPLSEALETGRAILVAEDNEINQSVILRQLFLLGYAAEVVSNGRQALDRWIEKRHRLILADYHMPELDGIGLTQAIRNIEANNPKHDARHTIIIAFTANALKGECERMLAAGMDDFISKPVMLDQLSAKLDHWASIQTPETSSSTANRPDDLYQPDLSILAALIGDDPAIIHEFVTAFIGQAEHDLAQISAACPLEEDRTIAQLAHKLKSSARTIGANEFATILETLEQEAKAANWKEIKIKIMELQGAFRSLLQHLDS